MESKNATQEQRKQEEYEKGRQQAAEAIDGAKEAANKAAGKYIINNFICDNTQFLLDKVEETADQAKGIVGSVVDTVSSVVGGIYNSKNIFCSFVKFLQGTVQAVADVAYNTLVTAENIGLGAAHMTVDAGKFATGWAVGMLFK